VSRLLSRLASWRGPGGPSSPDETLDPFRDGGAGGSPRSPSSPRRTPGVPHDPTRSLVFQAAALVLSYPDEAIVARLDVIQAALEGTPAAGRFAPVLAHLRGPLADVQAYHVQEFDLSRRHALHLTYWTDGDTRRRGEVLAGIKGVYRESGLVVDTRGELPDHLPIVLEFAVADPVRGAELLEQFRASVELIRLGLAADHLPHAGVLEAVCDLLPGESPKTRAEVQSRFGHAQPVEFVGLESLGRPGGGPDVPREGDAPIVVPGSTRDLSRPAVVRS